MFENITLNSLSHIRYGHHVINNKRRGPNQRKICDPLSTL